MSVRRICPKCKKVQSDTERVGRDICYHCRVFKGIRQTHYSISDIKARMKAAKTPATYAKWRALLSILAGDEDRILTQLPP